ncbi:MAG: DUF4167 domain-containing protein [Nitratireductor sp.]
MRPQQQKNRMRGRGRKQPNPLSRNYESNGPDVKIRGNASHIAEKYSQLARDAQSAGDRVMAENYLQHAEHYYRIIAASQPVQRSDEQPGAGYSRNGQPDYDGDDDEGYTDSAMEDRPLRSNEGRDEGRGYDNRNDSRGNDNRGAERNARSDRDGQRNDRQGGDNRRNQAASSRNRDEGNRDDNRGNESRGNDNRRHERDSETLDLDGDDQPMAQIDAVGEAPAAREPRNRDDSRTRRRPRGGETDAVDASSNGEAASEPAPRSARAKRPARREGKSADAAALPESLFAPIPSVPASVSGEVANDE